MFTLNDLQELFPRTKGNISTNFTIEKVITDSRTKTENALFVPIIGNTFDGHKFIQQAIENGAIAALWDEKVEIPNHLPEGFVIYTVGDTIEALQHLAKAYRNKVNPIVIGITGSNGKTTTKDLIKSVLQTKRKTHATAGNFNNHIGLPLTILEMPADTEILITEMGMSDFGEIKTLSNIAMPDYAIITNIGESHIEHLGSRSGIAEAKLEIRHGLKEDGILLIDGDEILLETIKAEANVISCGMADTNTVVISNISVQDNVTDFSLNGEQFTIPLLGAHHAKNASFAITVARDLDYDKINIQKGLKTFNQSTMRFEKMTGKNGATIINDAYNASATSMKAGIEVVKQLSGFKHKGLVLGDILELGEHAKTLHLTVADVIDESIQFVYTFGESANEISALVKNEHPTIRCKHFLTKSDLTHELSKELNADTLLFFKASRGMKFEEIIESILE
ncbi:UDP-N-acetylmuramoyl-tripeptide--D-alanyl-D-alanine ligase [Pseudogracilibacillus sp. SE30717A]|uniref:UDP-N-acetylmuramoyl-tripeptide--D-alanyl-D- alanine ligase n=1 Tax=Pseudogracilibacillus sp. SE30717A TaxID=3098293 RepID=UPI00300E40A6